MMKMSILAGWLVSSSVNATILVPAYFYPSSEPSQSFWDEMSQATGQVDITAIMNPDSGPGVSVNSDYTSAVNAFRLAGGKVLGYIHTDYGARSQADVQAEVARYADFYSIDGIFIDAMSNQSADLDYYLSLYSYIKSTNPGYQIFGNPGTQTLESYLAAADVLVTYEDHVGYDAYVPDAWTMSYPADRFGHLIYGVGSEAEMRNYVALAASRNVGHLYVTNDVLPNPWDTLPSYWDAEVSAVSSVPEPDTRLLLLAGLGLIGWAYRWRSG